MENLNNIKAELQRILENFHKSRGRPYTQKTLQEKEKTVNELFEKAKTCATKIADAETVLKIKDIYAEIKDLVDKIKAEINKQNQDKMAFDMKTATALVQHYNGNHEDTDVFIEAIELLDELTPAEQKGIMLKFIKTRITGKAKYVITDNINTVAQIADKLRQKFSIKLSSDALLAQLRTNRQGNKKLAEFANQIEDLSRQLARAFVTEKVAEGEAAEKLAEKFSIQSFSDNLANPETAIILKASNLNTLSEIVAKAMTVDKPQSSSILHYNAKQRGKFSPNYQRIDNSRNRPRYRSHNNFGRHSNNNRVMNNGQQRQRNQNTVPSRFNNNHFSNRQNSQNNNRRINHYGSGEYQPPQPNVEPTRLGEIIEIPEYTN